MKKETKNYYVLIALVTDESADIVTAGLVRKGFQVKPLSVTKKHVTRADDNLVNILNLDVQILVGDDVTEPRLHVFDSIKKMLHDASIPYYMMWIAEPCMCTWDVGNIMRKKIEIGNAYREAVIPDLQVIDA